MAVVTSPHTLVSPSSRAERRPAALERSVDRAEPMQLHVRGLRTASVARSAAVLGALVAAASIVAGVVVWTIAGGVGLLDGIERAVASGLGMESWSLPGGTLLLAWVAVVGLITTLAVAFVVLLTVAFNALARTGRGVDLLTEAVPGADAR